MWIVELGEGSGSRTNNVHSFKIGRKARYYGEYYQIIFTVSDKLSCKLEDSSGCQHDLPYFFTKARKLKKFDIIVDGCVGDSEYDFKCSLYFWPKEFPIPIAKFYSLGTARIISTKEGTLKATTTYRRTFPSVRYRRKEDVDWTNNSTGYLLKFNRCDEIFEVQLYSTLPNGIAIHSPTIEVDSKWQEFDFETACQIDLEELNLQRRFSLVVDHQKLYEAKCQLYLKNITLGDEEIPFGLTKTELVVPGCRYELKLEDTTLNLSYSRIFDVPDDHPIDTEIWTTLFGSADRVIFSLQQTLQSTSILTNRQLRWGMTEKNLDTKNLVLYKHGFYSFKSTFQKFENVRPEITSDFGGTFALSRLDSANVQINLSKLYKSKTSTKPIVEFSPIDPDLAFQEGSPAIYLPPELLCNLMSYYIEDDRLKCRLVCKSWCLAVDPTTFSGTFTSRESLQLFNCILNRSKDLLY